LIIDVHAHVWAGSVEQDKKEVLRASERYGISKIYVSGIKAEFPTEAEIEQYNLDAGQFKKEHPELIDCYCHLNPRHASSLDTLRWWIEQEQFAGMKLWIATLCDDPLVLPLVEQCIDYNVPILLHSFHKAVGQLVFETTGVHVARLAERYPEAKILMAHLGGNCYHGIKAIRKYPNVWVDFSGTLFNRDEIDYTKKQIGAQRILFGTDMPGPFLINQGLVEEADLTDEEREDIFFRNALRLFDRNEGVDWGMGAGNHER